MPAPKELLRWASDNEGAPSLAIFERRSSLVEIARALYTHNAGAPSFAFLNEGAPTLG